MATGTTPHSKIPHIPESAVEKDDPVDEAMDRTDRVANEIKVVDVTGLLDSDFRLDLATLATIYPSSNVWFECRQLVLVGSAQEPFTVVIPQQHAHKWVHNLTDVTITLDSETGTAGNTVDVAPNTRGEIGTDGDQIFLLARTSALDAGTERPFDPTYQLPGNPAGGFLLAIPFARFVDFPAGMTGSVAWAEVAATLLTVFTIVKDPISGTAEDTIGTVEFAAGARHGTFNGFSAQNFEPGDTLIIYGQAAPDDTLANVAITFKGERK